MAGTYVGLKPTKQSQLDIQVFAQSLGIKNLLDSKEYHVTMLYAPDAEIDYKPKPSRKFKAVVTGAAVLGEGKWQGLVLKLRSAELHRRHMAIKKVYGEIHSYPDFTLHITLKYRPAPDDIKKLKAAIPKGMELIFSGEYTEELKGDG